MELLVVPIIVLLGGFAIYLALTEKPVTGSDFVTYAPAVPSTKVASLRLLPPMAAPSLPPGTTPKALAVKRSDNSEEKDESEMSENQFSPTDVLLADALTEMIGLKAEIYRLRSKVEILNTQVARLSGEPPTTPSVAKRPVLLKKAA